MTEHTGRRRDYSLQRVAQLDREIAQMEVRVWAEVQRRAEALRLKTHAGVGPQTALATVLSLGEVSRFGSARAVSAYLGLMLTEHSCGRQAAAGTHQQAGLEPACGFCWWKRGRARCSGTRS